MLCNKLALDVVGNELVAGELGGEAGAAASERAQRDAVVAQFLQGYLGLQFLVAGLGVHAHDERAAPLKVAHHVTHVVGRNIHLQVVDGLKNLRTGLLEGIREGMTSRKSEGKLIGVNRMHLAVVDHNTNIACLATCQRTAFHAVHHTFEDGRHKTKVYGTTHDRVDKHELSAPW